MPLRVATVRHYLEDLRAASNIAGATEHTHRPPLVDFLKEAALELGFGDIDVHSELRLAAVGQPDLQVTNSDGVAVGYGETKVPGSATRFAEVLASEQVGRYRATLENLLVTDFLRFTLFRPEVGRLDVTLVETPGMLAAGAYPVSAGTLQQLSQLLSALYSATAPTATSAEMLADGLARQATLLRDTIRSLLLPKADEGEGLRQLWDFYRRTLMSDMESDDFADTYAQTLIYALFLSRLEGGAIRTLDQAWKAIPDDIPILRSAIEPLRVGSGFPAAMSVWLTDALNLLASTPDAVVATIGHPSAGAPDPILYFYEHFLAAYDKVERIRRGVYYTPRPLVDYLVRAVHDSLKRDFGKGLGLASTEVQLLDPAVGTGTFLLAAAQTAVDEVGTALGSGSVRAVLEDHVLQHFYGFELLPAPYTISHVKFALFAREHHVRFLAQRAPVFLTNTLGDPLARNQEGGLLAFFVPGLIDEAAAAERVKSDEQILVILGNPPWSATSHNKQPEIERLFAAWKTIDGRPGSPLIDDARIALNDDYLKFMRWAVWKLFEQVSSPRKGILAFVTNHGFINGRIHRGIRKALLDAFDEIWVFNLQGNQRLWVKGLTDEKVFPDVQQGVAMTVFIKHGQREGDHAAVHYRELRGTRKAKYEAAAHIPIGGDGWAQVAPSSPFWSFAPGSGEDMYQSWPSVTDIFPVNSSGVQTQRDDLVSDTDPTALASRMHDVLDHGLTALDVVERHRVSENSGWTLTSRRSSFAAFDERRSIRWLYRLFDHRSIYWDPEMMGRPRLRVMQHLLPVPFGPGGQDRLALVVQRARPIAAIATVTRGIATAHVTGNWCHVYPLHLADHGDEDTLLPRPASWTPNLSKSIASALESTFGRAVEPESIFWYVFGVLSAPGYRDRFKAELEFDHPHVPFPANSRAFDDMAELGRRLGIAHLLEAVPPSDVRFVGAGDGRVGAPRFDEATSSVWINPTQHFTGVPSEAWKWGGAFRPLEHFLVERRGKVLDMEQVQMFQQAINAVRTSIEMAPALDAALYAVLAETLDVDLT